MNFAIESKREKRVEFDIHCICIVYGLYNIQIYIGHLNSKKAGKNWHFYGSDVPKSTLDIFLA